MAERQPKSTDVDSQPNPDQKYLIEPAVLWSPIGYTRNASTTAAQPDPINKSIILRADPDGYNEDGCLEHEDNDEQNYKSDDCDDDDSGDKTYTGFGKFPCKICNRRFKQRDNCWEHYWAHVE